MGKPISRAKRAAKRRMAKGAVVFTQGRGRPKEFQQEYVDIATRAARLGSTNEALAKFFDINLGTLQGWMRDHEDFSNAIREGREYADAHVADSLYRRAIGYSHAAVKIFPVKTKTVMGEGEDKVVTEEHDALTVPYTEHYPPDVAACIFWLKNRRPDLWRDKIDVAPGTPVLIDQSTHLTQVSVAPERIEEDYFASMKDVTALVEQVK